MTTQAERATQRREGERARQKQQAQARRGTSPEIASPSDSDAPTERVVVIAYEEPPEAAWNAAASPPPRRVSTRTIRVRLDTTLASLPPGEDRVVELTDEPQEMREHVAFCLATAGWEGVRETYSRVREVRDGQPVAAECYAAAQSLVTDLSGELAKVEARAREVIRARLEVSNQQLQAMAETFLTGLDLSGIDLARIDDTAYRRVLRLRPGDHLLALRDLLRDLVPLNQNVSKLADAYSYLSDRSRGIDARDKALRETGAKLAEARVRRAQRVFEVSGRWPLVAWLADLEPEPEGTEDVLLERVIDEISLVQESIVAVGRASAVQTAWPKGTVSGEEFRRGIRPALLDIEDLGDNPFGVNMRSPRGPWRYPLMIGRALEELGHTAPSTVAAAAQEAMGGREATGLVYTFGGGIGVLSWVFPPAGFLLGGAMATWNLMVDLDERATRKAAYRAVLDPAQSIDVAPSLRGVVAGVLGVIGSVVPGWSGFVIGGGELVVRITTDGN